MRIAKLRVKTELVYSSKLLYRVVIVRGVQSFRLDYCATKDECDWYAEQLRKVLRRSGAVVAYL